MNSVFDLTPSQIKAWAPKDPITAARLTEPGTVLNRLTGGVAFPRMNREAGLPLSGGDGKVRILFGNLSAVFNDYIEFVPFDGVNTLATVQVAKPYQLRRTPFDGKTVNGVTYTYTSATTRSATNGVTTETQVIVPQYYVGARIFVAAGINGSGVLVNNLELDYVDLNTDARAWAKQ